MRTARVLHLRYCRVIRNDGKPALWLPLFLAEQRRFVQQLRLLADADNPLVKFFADDIRYR